MGRLRGRFVAAGPLAERQSECRFAGATFALVQTVTGSDSTEDKLRYGHPPMTDNDLQRNLVAAAGRYGIGVRLTDLADDVPGEFDGPNIRLNQTYDATERAFYLAHSIGSIAQWSLHPDSSQEVMRELRAAKAAADSTRLNDALQAYLAFETRTWEFAVWLLQDLGYAELVPAFTRFGRADMEAMRIFHATGKAPVWNDFFATWNEELRSGARTAFDPQPIPAFQAIRIPKQEIVQEDDGH